MKSDLVYIYGLPSRQVSTGNGQSHKNEKPLPHKTDRTNEKNRWFDDRHYIEKKFSTLTEQE
jgi:hypothetical protein